MFNGCLGWKGWCYICACIELWPKLFRAKFMHHIIKVLVIFWDFFFLHWIYPLMRDSGMIIRENCSNYWADLIGFWTKMIAVTLPFFSYLFWGSSGSISKVDCIALSKVWTTGMLVAGEGPPEINALEPKGHTGHTHTGNAELRT